MTNEEFSKLTRDEMLAEIAKIDPALTRGKTRARKDELTSIFFAALSAASPTGRAPTQPVLQGPLPSEPSKPAEAGLDYPALEMRVAAGLLAEPQDKDLHTQITEAMFGAEIPVGGASSLLSDQPAHVVISRKSVVTRAVSALGQEKILAIARYKQVRGVPSRKFRRKAEALRRQISKFLPKGIGLEEIMAVLA